MADYDQNGASKNVTWIERTFEPGRELSQTKDGHWIILVTSSDRRLNGLQKRWDREDMLTDERFIPIRSV